MSENITNSFNEDDQGKVNSDNSNSGLSEYEKISSYIDEEFDNETSEEQFRELINSNPQFSNRYHFEKLLKQELQRKIKPITVPDYLVKTIRNRIDNYSSSISHKHSQEDNVKHRTDLLQQNVQIPASKSELQQRKYFYYFSGSFAFLLMIFLFINFFGTGTTSTDTEDIISISRDFFYKIESGEIELQYITNNHTELESSLSRGCRFKVFVPPVKDAILLGGVYNEINGVPVAHFVHQKGNRLIYTFQVKMQDISDEPQVKNKLYLVSDIKSKLRNGENWFPCTKSERGDNAAIWHKDDVICSSVSKMNFEQIHATLTDFR